MLLLLIINADHRGNSRRPVAAAMAIRLEFFGTVAEHFKLFDDPHQRFLNASM